MNSVKQKNAIFALKRLFYLQSGNKDVFEKKVAENKVIDFSIKKPLGIDLVKNCPFDVPLCFAPNGELKNRTSPSRKPPAEKYSQLYSEAVAGSITNNTLRYTLNKWVKELGNICIKDINGFSFFESNAKGTARYNKKNYWKIHDFCKQEDDFGKKAYFCTFTCQYDEKKDNIIHKWQLFSEQINFIMKKLSCRYGVEYILVKESFLSGYPHAHAILYVNDFCKDDKQRYLRSKKYSVVVDSGIKRLLNKYFTLGYTELVRNIKKGTSNYLSKYISKNDTKGLKSLTNKKKWNNADRKQILTVFMPILSNVRQFQKSIKISDLKGHTIHFENFLMSKKVVNCSSDDIIQKSLYLSNQKFLDVCRASDYLITLCNNLPKCIQKQVCVLSNKVLWKFTLDPISEVNKESSEYKQVLFNKSKCLNCSDCVYAKFLAELLTKNEKSYHKGVIKSIIPEDLSHSLAAEALTELDKEDNKSIYSKEIEVFNSSAKRAKEIIEQMSISRETKDPLRPFRLPTLLKQDWENKHIDFVIAKDYQNSVDSGVNALYNKLTIGVEYNKNKGVLYGTEPMLF